MDLTQARIRLLSARYFGDPIGFLRSLRQLEYDLADSPTPERIKTLRTNGLKAERELRDGAIFCVGMSSILGSPVKFAPGEAQDFDCVAMWVTGDTEVFCPIQLKEVVPAPLNPSANVQGIVDKLAEHRHAEDLTVAIKFNRRSTFNPEHLVIPRNLRIGALWIYGAISEDQSLWAMWGDLMRNNRLGYIFSYPA